MGVQFQGRCGYSSANGRCKLVPATSLSTRIIPMTGLPVDRLLNHPDLSDTERETILDGSKVQLLRIVA